MCVTGDVCQGGPLQRMNKIGGGNANVFADLAFSTAGKLVRWEFWPQRPGLFYAGVWRPQGNQFLFIGANAVTVTSGAPNNVRLSKIDKYTL